MSLLVYLVIRFDCWFSVGCLLFVRTLCTCVIPLAVTVYVSAFPREPASAFFAYYLTLTVQIRNLESIFPVLLASSLVWWDSP